MTDLEQEQASLRAEQIEREAEQRRAAVGRRVDAIQQGLMGPVVKRWINADIIPIADNLRRVAGLYLEGDMEGVALALGTPTSALSQRERPLRPLMEWACRGRSPGRAELKDTSHAEDLALAFMGSLVPRLASASDGVTLSAGLSLAAEALKDTVQGQFITGVQGAKAMQKIREKEAPVWAQRKSLQRIAMQMQAQVKPEMLKELEGEDNRLETIGHRKMLHVTDHKGELRRLEFLKVPDEVDWEVMDLCWEDRNSGETSPHRSTWLAFAAMMLSLAQQSSGWFLVADKFRLSRGRKRKTKLLLLSDEAHAAIQKDVERWVANGFLAEPMIVPPVDGDWLTVKHRKVTGQRPPKGLLTNPKESFAWEKGALALAESPWRVNPYALGGGSIPLEGAYELMKDAAHRRLGTERDFYLPVNMDFRGRVYYRTPWVTPQSDDLGKSLLMFPPRPEGPKMMDQEEWESWYLAWVQHIAGLYGNGVDKLPMSGKIAWYSTEWSCEEAEKPRTLHSHMALADAQLTDQVPIQLDGTCNGLQHLSALCRDEVGAEAVNLCAGGPVPEDVYARVADEVEFAEVTYAQCEGYEWVHRLRAAGVQYDRALCKGPVMVLPYGGTIEAIRLSVKAAVLKQLGVSEGEQVQDSPWHSYGEDGYGAFKERALADHPLFNRDLTQLALLVHGCIAPAIPKAMAAMDTLQAIGGFVGERGLAWQTGPKEAPLWVVQAKAKSSRKQVTMKGYHLPDVIRRLTLMTQTNEVDPRAHRTGIVANFIHSLDAEHLARSIAKFKAAGGSCVGAIHDCVMCRPSEVHTMHRALREAFREMYAEDPLTRPVRIIPLDGSPLIEYANWHDLAQDAGVSFPEHGSWRPEQVLASEWFFS